MKHAPLFAFFVVASILSVGGIDPRQRVHDRASRFPGGDRYRDRDEVSPRLYVGNAFASTEDVTHVVNSANEWPCPKGDSGVTCVDVPMSDNPYAESFEGVDRALDEGARSVRIWLREKPENRVLVRCNMGVSRSVSIVIRYLQQFEGLAYDEALRLVRRSRPIAQPNSLYERVLRSSDHSVVRQEQNVWIGAVAAIAGILVSVYATVVCAKKRRPTLARDESGQRRRSASTPTPVAPGATQYFVEGPDGRRDLPELSAHVNEGGEEEDFLELDSEEIDPNLYAEETRFLERVRAEVDSATFPWSEHVVE